MDDERLNWPQTSVSSSNPPASLNNDEDLLDFELESETCMRTPSMHPKFGIDSLGRNSSTGKDNQDGVEKDYSFFVKIIRKAEIEGSILHIKIVFSLFNILVS